MKNSIINIKAWNRPNMLGKTLSHLSQCYNIKNYNVIISIDGPTPKHNISKFESHINASNIKKSCKDIKIIYHPTNIGCAGNMKFCFIKSFKQDMVDWMIHLEDDTPPAKDFLLFMEWGYQQMKKNDNIFCICPFIRKNHLKEHNIDVNLESDIDKVIYRNNFEPGGGFAITRYHWEKIKNNRGVFGVIGPCGTPYQGEEWLNNLKRNGGVITDRGSWAWVFRKMYLGDKKVLFPKISRTQNIGDKGGAFNPSASWHQLKIFNPKWANNEFYKNFDLENMEYNLLTN